MSGPRIYNLFPLLAGPVTRWSRHLDRIARMGFDWVYLNPVQYAGFSGSLYAIKDPYAYHLALLASSRSSADSFEKRLRTFIGAAGDRGMRVMLDLVINHTSKDALLAEAHPDWYRHEEGGSLKSPSAIDPADARRVTVWGDLAELDYETPESRDGLTDYWTRFLEHCLSLGFSGFRCDAAYKVPAATWRELIEAARRGHPDTIFCAETLGCRIEEINAVASAGFDLLFNSSKWWDFRAPWCLEQYDAQRHIAPSISFPETHDTLRLAEECDGRPDILRQRYLFAAAFSAGVMIPMGFEYGARKRLDVVQTRDSDREAVLCDLTDFIAGVNAWKATTPVLNSEAPIRCLSSPDERAVRLYKSAIDGSGGVTDRETPSGIGALSAPGLPFASGTTIAAGSPPAPGEAAVFWINPGEDAIGVPASWLEEAERLLGATDDRIMAIRSSGSASHPGLLQPNDIVVLRAVSG